MLLLLVLLSSFALHLLTLAAAFILLLREVVPWPTALAVLLSVEIAIWTVGARRTAVASDEPQSPPRRSALTAIKLAAVVLLLAGLLVAWPIHEIRANAWCALEGQGPLRLVKGLGALSVIGSANLWYGLLWRRLDNDARAALGRDAWARGLIVCALPGCLWAWWRVASCEGSGAERAGAAFLVLAAPTLVTYLVRALRWHLGKAARATAGPLDRRSAAKRNGIGAALLAALSLVLGRNFFLPGLDTRAGPETPEAEARTAAHELIVSEMHDACLMLPAVGNETSVPRLIALLEEQDDDQGHACTYLHCISALEELTNHRLGHTRGEWQAWYAANKHKTRVEWIRDGYVVAGFTFMAEPSPRAARMLLSEIGSASDVFPHDRKAETLLRSYADNTVNDAIATAVRSGTPEERRGAMRVGFTRKIPELAGILERLAKEDDRRVRTTALLLRVDLASASLTNPPGFQLRSFKLDVRPTHQGVLTADGAFLFATTNGGFAAYDLRTGAERWRTDRGAGPPCLDGDHFYSADSDGAMRKARTSDGGTVWSSPPLEGASRYSFGDIECHGPVLVQSGPLSEGRIVVHSKADGRQISSARGELLKTTDGLVIAGDGHTVRAYELPGLSTIAAFQVGSEAVGAAVGKDVTLVVLTRSENETHPRQGPTWVEGWSASRGRVWGPIPMGGATRERHGVVQTDTETAYVSQGGLVTALRISDGHVLWESAPDGALFSAGRELVVATLREGLFVLDPRSGRPAARFHLKDVHYYENVLARDNELIAADMDETVHVFRLPGSGWP